MGAEPTNLNDSPLGEGRGRRWWIYGVAAALALAAGGLVAYMFSDVEHDGGAIRTTGPPPTTTTGSVPDVNAQIDQVLDGLRLGSVAFNAPTSLHKDQPATIQLLLSPTKTVAKLQSELDEIGKREGARIEIAGIMEAQLTGAGFRITAITPDRQAISERENTEWRWDIEPVRTGSQRLHLQLNALIDVDGEREPRSIETFNRIIVVKVGLGDRLTGFVGNNWQWLWAVLVPVVIWAWRRVKHRREDRGFGR